ncbi:MAG: 1,2-phenylacetyl-CoA epoxidase subunit PaaC, partial [Acetobacteraceae bacterium]
FDAWHHLLLGALQRSSDARIAEIAEKAIKEVTYHLERSGEWVVRLGDGTEESHRRVRKAFDLLWPYTGELFETDEVEETMARSGAGTGLARLREPWLAQVAAILGEATLPVPQSGWMQRGGKRGIHSEHLGYLLAELQFLQRAYPGATW